VATPADLCMLESAVPAVQCGWPGMAASGGGHIPSLGESEVGQGCPGVATPEGDHNPIYTIPGDFTIPGL
jgi:hypothetical protein